MLLRHGLARSCGLACAGRAKQPTRIVPRACAHLEWQSRRPLPGHLGMQRRPFWNAMKSMLSIGHRLATGEERDIAEDITLGTEIGMGRYGKVYNGQPTAKYIERMLKENGVATDGDGDAKSVPKFAVKKIPKMSLSREYEIQVHDLMNEIKALRAVQGHRNIMRYVDVYEDR
jgi:hypothetical protein